MSLRIPPHLERLRFVGGWCNGADNSGVGHVHPNGPMPGPECFASAREAALFFASEAAVASWRMAPTADGIARLADAYARLAVAEAQQQDHAYDELGSVYDAGGGSVAVFVRRDLESYPANGTLVYVRRADG